jgi:hypothetical protein
MYGWHTQTLQSFIKYNKKVLEEARVSPDDVLVKTRIMALLALAAHSTEVSFSAVKVCGRALILSITFPNLTNTNGLGPQESQRQVLAGTPHAPRGPDKPYDWAVGCLAQRNVHDRRPGM